MLPTAQALLAIAGQPVAKALTERYGSLTSLAQASFDESAKPSVWTPP